MPTISWSDAVDEALCFGWIDSTRKSLGDDRFIQFFCKRKPKSNWSKINKAKIEKLTDEGLMTKAGFASVELAKKNGSWNALDQVEELLIPKDLASAFRLQPGSKKYFTGLSQSVQKILLHWVAAAKRSETRQKRIDELAEHAGRQTRPKQFL
ncbi:YdeI/OmpD-associated family protein [Lacibacter luteus]|nr:YdeI/OmpD-associated family protein [Lacibacter luteus]